jgi:hypothetical protein
VFNQLGSKNFSQKGKGVKTPSLNLTNTEKTLLMKNTYQKYYEELNRSVIKKTL